MRDFTIFDFVLFCVFTKSVMCILVRDVWSRFLAIYSNAWRKEEVEVTERATGAYEV